MALMENLLSDWQRWTCSHHWVRARWDDGSYGLRCAHCMKPYHHTWNEIIAGPKAVGAVGSRKEASREVEYRPMRRAA